MPIHKYTFYTRGGSEWKNKSWKSNGASNQNLTALIKSSRIKGVESAFGPLDEGTERRIGLYTKEKKSHYGSRLEDNITHMQIL